ncbi:MAG TPA: hypothetical protein DCX08_01220 [Porticoccaceae bacterium]|jgi:hypothetical protein|nr:hypothetical protein [Porticoccaceae bacterium]
MQSDPLAKLRDIHLPEPISWWPLAPGWWILVLSTMGLLIWLIIVLFRRYQTNLYRREALQKLKFIEGDTSPTYQQKLVRVFALLKQTVNSVYPDEYLTSKHIDSFVLFLKNSSKEPVFEDLPDNLALYLYGNVTDENEDPQILEHLIASSDTWIKSHPPLKDLKAQVSC